MAHNTSSAIPEQLIWYSKAATDLDHTLQSTARRLRSQLEHFEQRCSESGIRLSASFVAEGLRHYSGQCEPIDSQVRDVGQRFQIADRTSWKNLLWRVRPPGWTNPGYFLPIYIIGLKDSLKSPIWLRCLLSNRSWIERLRDAFSIPAVYAAEAVESVEDLSTLSIAQMTREQRTTRYEQIQTEMTELQNRLEYLKTQEGVGNLNQDELERQIAELRKQRTELQDQADQWRNKLGRSQQGWKWGFDDGIIDAPWRTRSDDIEDEITSIDNQIAELEKKLEYQREYDRLSVRLPEIERDARKLQSTLCTAETVSADEDRRTYKEATRKEGADVALYYRGQYTDKGTTQYSNCTWYAAAAVKEASGGRIDLNSGSAFTSALGDASSWDESARAAINPDDPKHDTYKQYQDCISAVDKQPEPGSVYCKDNHVMFVEDARLVEIDGKKQWQVTISEENWSGSHYKGAERVEVPDHPEVLRWRRDILLPVDSDDPQAAQTGGEFIHFNYEGYPSLPS